MSMNLTYNSRVIDHAADHIFADTNTGVRLMRIERGSGVENVLAIWCDPFLATVSR